MADSISGLGERLHYFPLDYFWILFFIRSQSSGFRAVAQASNSGHSTPEVKITFLCKEQ